jgi:NAD-dependent SIR2 family protein deacetylase
VLSELIRDNQPCVALTGAGVSTESGIPDFRSADGIWAQYDPMEYASIEAFRRDPVKVWEFYGKRLGALLEAKPNAAHDALAELERRGLLSAVITQNIDRLHALAGSQDVVEVHGSIATSVCLRCGTTATLEDVLALLEDAPAPACPSCGAILKPNVVMFGELLPGDGDRPRVRARTHGAAAARPSARRSRSIRWPGCRSRRSVRAARSRSSTAARRRSTRSRRYGSRDRPGRSSAESLEELD